MSDRAPDQWWDESWNPITGCTHVSPACDHCWAAGMAKRFPQIHGGRPFHEIRFHTDRLFQPMKWSKPKRIFVCSVGDFWHPNVQPIQRVLVLDVIRKCPHHTFILLTKRAKEMNDEMTDNSMLIPFVSLPNVIAMVTVENQERADERIPYLLSTPWRYRGVSIEPMLGAVDLGKWMPTEWYHYTPRNPLPSLDWAILGGETGPGARKCDYEWAISVRDQCEAAGVPFFYKGIGTHKGVKKSNPYYNLLSGNAYHEFPEVK